LELIKGSPFASKNKAAKALGIPRATMDLVLDKGDTAGSKAIYVYSRSLNVKEIEPLLDKAGQIQLGLKKPVYVYDANTLELVNNTPFDSLLDTAKFFDVNYRTISRHLNTNKAIKRSGRLVYFFLQKLDVQLSKQLLTARRRGDSRNYNTKV
jgi:NUMOD1 domain